MAEEVTKVVENVDKLFSEIVVNGESHVSDRYVAPEPAQSNPPASTNQEEPQQTQPAQTVQGQYVKAVDLNNVLHDFKDEDLGTVVERIESLIPSEASSVNKLTDKNYVDGADTAIRSDIGAEITALQNLVGAIQSRLTELNAMIPSQASAQNQLADKNFVNSSIATNTANFLGTYSTLAEIEAIQNPTNNDYAFLETTDSAGNTLYDRYKYSAEDEEWLFEYELNNSGFTAEQWATINSGLTSGSITDAINALDVASTGGNGKYIKSISEADGKISAIEGTIDSAVTQNSANPVSGGAVYQATQEVDEWSSKGVTVRKVGRLVTISIYVTLNVASPVTLTTIPARFRPTNYTIYGNTFVSNASDEPRGQAIVYTNGEVKFYLANGGTFPNSQYASQLAYIV